PILQRKETTSSSPSISRCATIKKGPSSSSCSKKSKARKSFRFLQAKATHRPRSATTSTAFTITAAIYSQSHESSLRSRSCKPHHCRTCPCLPRRQVPLHQRQEEREGADREGRGNLHSSFCAESGRRGRHRRAQQDQHSI